jgi:hypothetical protein
MLSSTATLFALSSGAESAWLGVKVRLSHNGVASSVSVAQIACASEAADGNREVLRFTFEGSHLNRIHIPLTVEAQVVLRGHFERSAAGLVS